MSQTSENCQRQSEIYFQTTGNIFFLLLCVSYRIVLVSDRIALVFVRESESMRGISEICNVV